MKISILGATGAVGAPTAFYLAAHHYADEILMIGGKRQNLLHQHVMDLSTAVAAIGTQVYAGSYADLGGSDIVINAAGLHQDGPQGLDAMLRANVPLMGDIAEQIGRHCPDACVITATNPVGPLNYAIYLSDGFDRHRIIGYSLNDSLRLRELAAEVLQVAVSRVSGVVIGEHGPTQVPVFSSIRVDNRPVTISPDDQQRIRERGSVIISNFQALKAGRTAGWTCAVGIAEYVHAIVHGTDALLPCSPVLDGEYGQHQMSMTVPAILGRTGISEILELSLTDPEIHALAISTEKLNREMRLVEQLLGRSA